MIVKEIRDALAPLMDDAKVIVIENGAHCIRPSIEPNDDGPGFILWVPDAGNATRRVELEQKIRALRVALTDIME